uniref:basic proline-rich protein-like n=1 Tax=Halichoerus grypus TaxID=9711 RepID=UPI001659C5FE|nr:basic proline-rich protein-like [Halichoerus grypus]XP_035980080.1 basic proline-rich protein-like [Halichoerus grypus]
MSVSLKSNTGSTFPRPLCQAGRAPISLPSLPSRALGRDPEDSVPLAWSNPASGSAFVTCSSAPHGHRCRAAASRRGREAPATAAAAARPPSLPPSLFLALPPSLPPSRAAARGALPRATCSGPNPGISERERERKKGPLMWERKKERPLTAFIFHALTTGRPLCRRPGPGPAAAEVCGACCLAHADRRAPRTARSTLGAAAPRQPKHHTDLKVLPTDSTSGCPPRGWPPPRSPLCSVCGQSPHTIHLVRALAPGRTPLLAKAPAGPPSGRDPAPDCKPPPLHGTHTKPSAHPQPPVPRRCCPSPVPEKGCISEPRQGRGQGRRVPGSRGAEVPGRPQRIGRAKPEPQQPASYLRDQGSPWRALAFSSVSRKS